MTVMHQPSTPAPSSDVKILSGGITLPDILDMNDSTILAVVGALRELRAQDGINLSCTLNVSVLSLTELGQKIIDAMTQINRTPGSAMALTGDNGHTLNIAGASRT
jgi:hypothetical protein